MLPSHHYSPQKSHSQAEDGREIFCAHYELQQGLFGVYLFLKIKDSEYTELVGTPWEVSEEPALPWGRAEAASPGGHLEQESLSPGPGSSGILKPNHLLLFICNSSTPPHTNCAERLSSLGNDLSPFARGKSISGCPRPAAEPGSLDMTNSTGHVSPPALPQQQGCSLPGKQNKYLLLSFVPVGLGMWNICCRIYDGSTVFSPSKEKGWCMNNLWPPQTDSWPTQNQISYVRKGGGSGSQRFIQ